MIIKRQKSTHYSLLLSPFENRPLVYIRLKYFAKLSFEHPHGHSIDCFFIFKLSTDQLVKERKFSIRSEFLTNRETETHLFDILCIQLVLLLWRDTATTSSRRRQTPRSMRMRAAVTRSKKIRSRGLSASRWPLSWPWSPASQTP